MIEPHQYLFDELHQKENIFIYIEHIKKTSRFKLWPPLIHCQIGMTIGLLGIFSNFTQEITSSVFEDISYLVTFVIGVFLTPICYFSLQNFAKPEIWKLNFENPRGLAV